MEFALFALPFVLVAAGLMWYNAARFGSPFDFGANYNLTSNDMTKRGFSAARIGPAILYYLFAPNPMSATFPYLSTIQPVTNAVGLTIVEQHYGRPVCLFSFFVDICTAAAACAAAWPKRDCGALWAGCCSRRWRFSVLDAQMAGILYRYQMDFALPVMFAGAVCWLAAENAMEDVRTALPVGGQLQRMLRTGMLVAVAAGLVFGAAFSWAGALRLQKQPHAV